VETVSRSDYFDAAIELLASGGEAAVTIAALCRRLGVTKGSFYHHFGSGGEFHRALLEHWEQSGAERVRAELDGVTDPMVRIRVLKELGNQVEHDSESAIRAWGKSFEPAAAVQRRVDAGRERLLREAFVDAGIDPERAATLARIGVTMLVGMQQIDRPVDTGALGRVFDEYERWLVAVIGEADGVDGVRPAGSRRSGGPGARGGQSPSE
jgi:AcrR family transcriptional regulator